MSRPSFAKINYAIRPNKNVQRKLIAETLKLLASKFPMRDYRYIGMGSMWFTDFSLFHRVLKLRDMISIERDMVQRARFNAPFCCIRVEEGETTRVLPAIGLASKPTILWLDYDTGIEGPAIEDSRIACAELAPRSVLVVTIEAKRERLDEQIEPYDFSESEGSRAAMRERVLRSLVGTLVPPTLPRDALSVPGYSKLLAEIMFTNVTHVLRKSGRPERFRRLFNFSYSDGTPMVTIGGIIVSPADDAKISSLLKRSRLEFPFLESDASGVESVQRRIEVPHLTPKEKFAIDRLLPTAGRPLCEVVSEELAFVELENSELTCYEEFYRHYPVFGEFLL